MVVTSSTVEFKAGFLTKNFVLFLFNALTSELQGMRHT